MDERDVLLLEEGDKIRFACEGHNAHFLIIPGSFKCILTVHRKAYKTSGVSYSGEVNWVLDTKMSDLRVLRLWKHLGHWDHISLPEEEVTKPDVEPDIVNIMADYLSESGEESAANLLRSEWRMPE